MKTRTRLQPNQGSIAWALVLTGISFSLVALLGGFGVVFMGGAMKNKKAVALAAEQAAVAAAPAPVAAAAPSPTASAAPAQAAPAPAPAAASATAAAGQAAASVATPAAGEGKVVDKDGVQEIEIGTHAMMFNFLVTQFTVKSGKKVRIVFKNTSTTVPQPHNLIICKPGKKPVIEALAQAMMTDPKAMEKGYIPESDEILVHSKLLQPNESENIEFTAPAPGSYDYTCTFPGHWLLMKGVMTVE